MASGDARRTCVRNSGGGYEWRGAAPVCVQPGTRSAMEESPATLAVAVAGVALLALVGALVVLVRVSWVRVGPTHTHTQTHTHTLAGRC